MAKGRNKTNLRKSAVRHAEIEAMDSLNLDPNGLNGCELVDLHNFKVLV